MMNFSTPNRFNKSRNQSNFGPNERPEKNEKLIKNTYDERRKVETNLFTKVGLIVRSKILLRKFLTFLWQVCTQEVLRYQKVVR